MKHNKYLDKLGLKITDYGTNWCTDKNDKRKKKWKKERKEYGFDSRETWNLNTTFVEWLYSHLKMYKKEANKKVDLTYHKFMWKGQEITQLDAINLIIKECEFYLLNKNSDNIGAENEAYKRMQEILKLWADIFPSMWW